MKKSAIPALLLFVLSNFSTNAQNLYLGANGGFFKNATIVEDYSPLRHLQPSWNKARLNTFNWGINLGYQLSDHWSFETQLQFVNTRYRERLDIAYHPHNLPGGWLFGEIDWYSTYHYTRVPLLAHYNIIPSQSKFGIGLIAGPNFGFLTKQTSRYIGVNEFGREIQNTLDYEEIPLKKVDWGVQLGLRVQSQLYRSVTMYVEGTIYQGFPNIIDYPEPSYNRPVAYYDDLNIVNRYFTFNIGVQYNFSIKNYLK